MDETIIFIYCLCDECLKGLRHHEDQQRVMTDAEVMTVALVAAIFFCGNFEKSRRFLSAPTYIPNMLGKSRFNRRLHGITDMFVAMFSILGEQLKEANKDSIYLIDSFPIAVCDNYRIPNCKIYHSEEYRGYIASKKRYFYGIRVHLLITKDGAPVEFCIEPGSKSDVTVMKQMKFDIPSGSTAYGDKAYNDYEFEDLLLESEEIHLLPIRKENSKRKLEPCVIFLQQYCRKKVEQVGSLLERMLPKSIHAVTAKGFQLKIVLFIVGLSINHEMRC